MKSKRNVFTLQPQQLSFLDAESKRTGASAAEIVRRALDFYQQHMEKSDGSQPPPTPAGCGRIDNSGRGGDLPSKDLGA